MGSTILVVMDSESLYEKRYLAPVESWFEEWEQCLSRFRHDSEVSQLNRKSGQHQPVSNELWRVVEIAINAAHQSNGLVNPLVLDALEQAGYTESFDTHQATAWRQETEQSANSVSIAHASYHSWQAIEMNADDQTICIPAGTRIDLGGFGKGWAAEQTMRRLKRYAPVIVDAGGDVAISGARADGSQWSIGVYNPMDPENPLELLMVIDGGVATSGQDYRCWQQGETTQHHIIDPRTGKPATTDILSVTVVASSLCLAEMAAKTIFILGSQQGLKWLETQPNMAAILILHNETIIRSQRLKHYLW